MELSDSRFHRMVLLGLFKLDKFGSEFVAGALSLNVLNYLGLLFRLQEGIRKYYFSFFKHTSCSVKFLSVSLVETGIILELLSFILFDSEGILWIDTLLPKSISSVIFPSCIS